MENELNKAGVNITSPFAGEVEFQHEELSVRNSGEGFLEKPSHRNYEETSKEFARNLRKSSTPQEHILWRYIKNNKLGYKFRRQFCVDNKYIVDFVCIEKRLIIELDGGHHNESDNDVSRTVYLQKQGFRVIRFWNTEIINNIEGCMSIIIRELSL